LLFVGCIFLKDKQKTTAVWHALAQFKKDPKKRNVDDMFRLQLNKDGNDRGLHNG